MSGQVLSDTETRPHAQRRGDKVHFSVNVATLVSMLGGGGTFIYSDLQSRAELKARNAVLEERMIQLQSALGEANARLAAR